MSDANLFDKIMDDLNFRESSVLRSNVKGYTNDLEMLEMLKSLTYSKLLSFRGCGPTTAQRIMSVFERHGLLSQFGPIYESFTDADLVSELRRRGYDVTAKKTVEL